MTNWRSFVRIFEKLGLVPVYSVNGTVYRSGQSVPDASGSANGYRLPTEAEWEQAARGGMESPGYTYSGSNDANTVAWTYENSSDGTKAVGTKAANEIGIHDMSWNVWEWCENFAFGSIRCFRGGGWSSRAVDAAVAYRVYNGDYPDNRRYDFIGIRLARSSGL